MQKRDQNDGSHENLPPLPPEVERGLRVLLAAAARYLADQEGENGRGAEAAD